MLTVWCVLWGDKYAPDYVYILRDMVKRNLRMRHNFVCLTDHDLVDVETINPGFKYHSWWNKLHLFEPGRSTDTNLYIDLDVIITGELDSLVDVYGDCELAMPANWAQSGHGGCQSSVMIWMGNSCHDLWNDFDYEVDSKRLWGDQEWITEKYGDPGKGKITKITPNKIVSYKYHCRTGLPKDARIVAFHGEPKPAQVSDEWAKQARRSLPISA